MRDGVRLLLGVADSPCPWAGTGAAAHSCFRWCRVATDWTDRQRTRIASRWANCACSAISLPRSYVGSSAAAWAHGGVFGEALTGTRRIRPFHPGQDDQPRGPFHHGADGRAIAGPLIRSPSQWPGTVRVATSAGRSAIGVILGSGRVGLSLAPEVGAPCAPGAMPPTVRYARLRGSTYGAIDGLCRSCRPISAGYSRQRRPAICSGEQPSPSAVHILPQPRVHELAGAPGLTGSDGGHRVRRAGARGATPHGVARRLAAHGAGARPNTLAIVRSEWPWPIPHSRSHVLRQSCVDRILFAWQHLSPSGPVVLHFE